MREQISEMVSRLGVMGELLGFLWRERLWWLIPMVVAVFVLACILAFGASGPGSLIYTLF